MLPKLVIHWVLLLSNYSVFLYLCLFLFSEIYTSLEKATTKTYQDFGLGFKIEYPSDLVLHGNADNITLNAPFFRGKILVVPWDRMVSNLDTWARHIALTTSNVTNKTKPTIDSSLNAR